MKLSIEAELALAEWIAPDTWHTGHKLDMDRFYRFVRQLWLDEMGLIDEAWLREHLWTTAKRSHPGFDEVHAKELIFRLAKETQNILEYESANHGVSNRR